MSIYMIIPCPKAFWPAPAPAPEPAPAGWNQSDPNPHSFITMRTTVCGAGALI